MEDEEKRTLYVGNLGDKVTEDILYELFLQAGPVNHVRIPTDRATNKSRNFGFVCFKDPCSVPFAVYMLDSTRLFNRSIRVQPRGKGQQLPPMDTVGIHSLDPEKEPPRDASSGSLLHSEPMNCGFMANNTPTPNNYPMYPQWQGSITPPVYNYGFNQHGGFNQQQGGYNQQQGGYNQQQGGYNQQQGGYNQQQGGPYQSPYFDARSVIGTDRLNDFKNAYENSHSGDHGRQRHSRRPDRYDGGDWGYDRQRREPNYGREGRNDSYDRSGRDSPGDRHHRSKSHRTDDRQGYRDRNDDDNRNNYHHRSNSYKNEGPYYTHQGYSHNRY